MAKNKWRNRILPRGIQVGRSRTGLDIFQIRVAVNGKRRKKNVGPVTAANLDLAISLLNDHVEKKRLGVLGKETEQARWTIETACETYWALHGSQRRKPDGQVNRKACREFRRQLDYITAAWSGRMIDTITYIDVRELRAKRLREGVKESTVNRTHTVITSLFNLLRTWRRLGQQPVPKNLVLPEDNPGELVSKEDEHQFIRDRLLTKEEYEMIWIAADNRIRRIILAEMNAPLRFEDLSQLTKDKINAKTNEFKGIQNKTGQDYYIPISQPMWELIRTAPGKQILDFRGFRKRWERAVKRAGLKGLQFRDLRRTAATTLHDKGFKLKVISSMLGHASVNTTERYLGLHAENLQEAGKALGEVYGVPNLDKISIETVPQTVPHFSNNLPIEFDKVVDK